MSATLRVRPEAADAGPPRRRPSRRSLILAGVGVVLVAALTVWLLAFSSVFGVRHVVVRGERTVSEQEIAAAAAIPRGAPLLRLDTAAVRTRVARLRQVAAVSVRTSLPSTVTITVTERVAVGLVKDDAGYELLDRTGTAFRSAVERPRGLPLFVVPVGPQHVAVDRAVATVAAQLPPAVRKRIRSVQALDSSAITLLMRDGRVVHWGSSADTVRKAELLPALLRQSNDMIDLSDPTQPFTR